MKRILLISTGGTISCKLSNDGFVPSLTFDDILSKLDLQKLDVHVDGVQLMNIDSGNIQSCHWIEISKLIKIEYDNYDGFVITHGTDTLAYTSAALSYLIQNSKKPIIITGAQKPISEIESDGINNLEKSIQVACEGVNGVFVAFDDKLILGTRARKIKSKYSGAFTSLNCPYAAYFEEDNIVWNTDILNMIMGNKEDTCFYSALNTRVTLIKLVPGLTPDVLDFLCSRYDAIVLEAYGIGSVPTDFMERIRELNDNCLIVVVSQCLREGTNMQKYKISRDVLNIENVIEGGLLSTECALTKLMWSLDISDGVEEVTKLINKTISLDNNEYGVY